MPIVGLLNPAYYINGFCGIMGLYGVQMLATPAKMVTDHFNMKSSPLLEFWIRGESVAIVAMCFLLKNVPTELAVQVATAVSLAIGILYPWNAKFGYLTPGLKLKYPMHYVPECLMLGLTVAGVCSM